MANWFTKNFLSGKAFFSLFQQAGTNVVAMARLLTTITQTDEYADRSEICTEVDRLEKAGDNIAHKIYLLLDQVSFPPFSKPDIYALTSAIDDVADYIQETTGRMNLYHLECIYPPMTEMADYLLDAGTEMQTLLVGLEEGKDATTMLGTCKHIKELESETDQIYYHALANLFHDEQDAIELLKKREILHSIESAVNQCKHVADVVEAMVLKRL